MRNFYLNGNTLKIIAALSMLIDHIGVIFLPDVAILRIFGRIAFPIYAFMIAEGCAYTKNKLRYFLTVFSLGVSCQIVYYMYDSSAYMGILITFSLSILVVYAMQYLKNALFVAKDSRIKQWVASVAFLFTIASVYFFSKIVFIDYGFWGCMAPVFASIFRKPEANVSAVWDKLDHRVIHILMLGICLVMLSCAYGGVQIYSLLAILLLLLYSGERGKIKMKYFFYIFYPVHLVLLEAVAWVLHG